MSNRYTRLDDRRLYAISGTESRTFLQTLVTVDVTLLSSEHSLYGALLTPQGKYFADFFLYHAPDGAIWLDVDATLAEPLITALKRYKMRADVEIIPLENQAVFAVWGELAQLDLPETPGSAMVADSDAVAVICTDPRLARMGARVAGDENIATWLQQRGFAYASYKDYETHRLFNAVPHSTQDFVPNKSLLLENGMEELHGVSFHKGCFVGQEVTARSKHRAKLHKLLYAVQSTDPHQPLPEPGTAVMQDGKEVGELRSTQGSQGMALLRSDAVEKGDELRANTTALTASLPDWRN